PGERRVAVQVGAAGGRGERLDDVRRRREVRVAATEVGERLAVERGRRGDPREQRREVLLRQPVESMRTRAHARQIYAADRSARRSSTGTRNTTSSWAERCSLTSDTPHARHQPQTPCTSRSGADAADVTPPASTPSVQAGSFRFASLIRQDDTPAAR